MKTLEHCVLDLFDDAEFDVTLQKIACNLSEEVQQEPLPTPRDRENMDDHDFALTMITKTGSKINKFPISDRINTALSNEYFELNHHKMPVDAQKLAAAYIHKACDKFDIEAQNSVKVASMNMDPRANIYVEPATKHATRMTKTAARDTQISQHYYALGTKYAMPNEQYLRKAEEYFDKYAMKLDPKDRHSYASTVTKRAEELGVKTASVKISRYSGENYNADLEGQLKLREKLLDEASPYVPALRKLASYAGKEEPQTFANVLHELDKKAGLEQYYDSYINDPYASTFGKGLEKQASYIYDKDGIYLTDQDIEKVATSKYATLKEHFGHTLADGLKKEGAAAFMGLPDDYKDIIARIANGEIQ